ncbi:MAG: cytochrome c [Bdellovibrionales bacterium]|nr:cytochrome c [Bdellovibrionales bacterium]
MATQDNKSDSKLTADSREESQDGVNSGGVVAFVISMVVTFACFIYVTFMSGGVDLKEVKATEDAGAVQTIAAAPEKVDVSDVTEPWLPNEKMVKHGAAVYKTSCAMCHGEKGAGDGVAGGSLNPKPRNLIEGKWKQGGTSLALFATLQNGVPGGSMQGYKDALPAKDRWALVQFIRSITTTPEADAETELKAKAPGLK